MGKYFLVILSLVSISACFTDDNSDLIDSKSHPYPEVDTNLWSYFSTFENEAAQRGYIIDLSTTGISTKFAYLPEDHVAGQCLYQSNAPGHITIDIKFWNQASELNREMIVFHELGHCYLNRDHLDTAFSNGICRSIMRSGTCCCEDAYNERNRSYYLDELFSDLVPL